jgi:hypothetical protein
MTSLLPRAAAALVLATGALLTSGCTTTLVAIHVYDRLTEGDPTPCILLNSVDRALQERCLPFQAGSLRTKDVTSSGLPLCPLAIAARNPAFWPVLPELIAKGAAPEACREAPWVALAQADACPDFGRASAAELESLRWLAVADASAIQHDVVRALSCPRARAVGLDKVLDQWADQGQLQRGQLAFGPLGALHPSHLNTPLARLLEAQGHTAAASQGSHGGQLEHGYELALRSGDFAALDWWLARLPELANRVPPTRGDQLAWVPLARVLTPSFVPDAAQQRETVLYLLAHGANPRRALPHDPNQSVLSYARQLRSPLVATLDAPPAARATRLAVRGEPSAPVLAADRAAALVNPGLRPN